MDFCNFLLVDFQEYCSCICDQESIRFTAAMTYKITVSNSHFRGDNLNEFWRILSSWKLLLYATDL